MLNTFVLNRDDYRDFSSKVDELSEVNITVPFLVDHNFVADTYQVTLLEEEQNFAFIMGED